MVSFSLYFITSISLVTLKLHWFWLYVIVLLKNFFQAEEMERVKNLVLTGKIPLDQAPVEMANHPVMLIEMYCRKLIAERRAKVQNLFPSLFVPSPFSSSSSRLRFLKWRYQHLSTGTTRPILLRDCPLRKVTCSERAMKGSATVLTDSFRLAMRMKSMVVTCSRRTNMRSLNLKARRWRNWRTVR